MKKLRKPSPASEALRAGEAHLRLLTENMVDTITHMDAQRNIVYVSPSVERVFGYRPQDLLGRSVIDQIHPDDAPALLQQARAAIAAQSPFLRIEYRYQHANGEYRWVESTMRLLYDAEGQFAGAIFGSRDVTDRKQAEIALRQRQQFIERVAGLIPDVLYVHDLDLGHNVFDNHKLFALLGLSAEKYGALGDEVVRQAMHPDDWPRFVKHAAQLRHLPDDQVAEFEYRMRHADGEYHWYFSRDAVFARHPDGTVRQIIGVATDITERKRAEERQREVAQFSRQIITSVAEGILVCDRDYRFTLWNPAMQRISGLSAAEVLGKKALELFPFLAEQGIVPYLERAMAGETVFTPDYPFYVPGSGRSGWAENEYVPLRDAQGEIIGVIGTVRDITARKQVEEELKRIQNQLLHAQKMEALGRLAGGIAHDFNNILTVIRVSTQLLEQKLGAQEPLEEHVQSIREAGQRASRLTQQLLSFSRREIVEPQILQLNHLVTDLSLMLRRIIGEDIQLITLLADDLWPVKIDPSQVDQVIANLAVNARDAMAGGGTLTVKTGNVVLDEAYTGGQVGVQPGEYVLLAVSDTGTGMDDEARNYLFEPFFTTKERGQGTGLGLATVFGIVKQNGGHIEVQSALGQGTTFNIYLPRATAMQVGLRAPRLREERQLKTGQPPAVAEQAGSETILLVEDEAAVRKLAYRVLSARGYRLLVAEDGAAALEMGEQYREPIHLLLTDVIMPRMGGRNLVDALQAHRPEMRVLYMSGYTDNMIVEHGGLPPGVVFLPKPFSIEELTRKVRAVLDGTV